MAQHDTPTNPKLPDYRPKGMSRGDKIMAWTLATIVLLFVLGTFTNYMNKTNTANSHPLPAASATVHKAKAVAKPNPNVATIKLSATDKWYVDAYATLHHTTEAKALTALIESGIKQQPK